MRKARTILALLVGLGALFCVAMTLPTYGLSLYLALILFTAAGFILPRTQV